jgi:hypothetical protein
VLARLGKVTTAAEVAAHLVAKQQVVAVVALVLLVEMEA